MQVLPNGNTHRPNEQVVWSQNRNTISTAGPKYRNFGRKRRLLIRNLAPEDSGVYECAITSNTTKRGRAELWGKLCCIVFYPLLPPLNYANNLGNNAEEYDN